MIAFDYTISTPLAFDAALERVQEELQKTGFRVLAVHNVQATLAEKGFSIHPMTIVEFCNAKAAYMVVTADPKMSLCLPCKISLYRQNNQTIISAMRPIVLQEFFPDVRLGGVPEEIDSLIKKIMDTLLSFSTTIV